MECGMSQFQRIMFTPRKTNMTMEKQQFEDVYILLKNGDFPASKPCDRLRVTIFFVFLPTSWPMIQLSNEKSGYPFCWLGYIGDNELPSYIGIM